MSSYKQVTYWIKEPSIEMDEDYEGKSSFKCFLPIEIIYSHTYSSKDPVHFY